MVVCVCVCVFVCDLPQCYAVWFCAYPNQDNHLCTSKDELNIDIINVIIINIIVNVSVNTQSTNIEYTIK